ncbi:hypothetical protein JTB14_020056 [Gonioctena quinquepunctata]|nr:hypothetical protein JTB14_020056 [Gonioctena quinquepunctata]
MPEITVNDPNTSRAQATTITSSEDLEDGDKESEAELLPKANSVPPTPSTSHKKDSKKDTIENTEVFKNPIDEEEPAKEEYEDNGGSKEETNNAYDTNQKHNENWPCYKEQFDFKKDKKILTPENICKDLKELIDVDLNVSHINDVYPLGKTESCPIKIEFISHYTKETVLQNCNKLRGKQVSIAQDLTQQQREKQKILRKHLPLAKQETSNECYN